MYRNIIKNAEHFFTKVYNNDNDLNSTINKKNHHIEIWVQMGTLTRVIVFLLYILADRIILTENIIKPIILEGTKKKSKKRINQRQTKKKKLWDFRIFAI